MSSARKYRNDPTTIMFICRALKIICDKDRSGPDLILTEGLLMLKLTFREHAMQIRTIHAALNVILTMLDNAGPRMHAALEAEGMEALLRQVQRDWTHEGLGGPARGKIKCEGLAQSVDEWDIEVLCLKTIGPLQTVRQDRRHAVAAMYCSPERAASPPAVPSPLHGEPVGSPMATVARLTRELAASSSTPAVISTPAGHDDNEGRAGSPHTSPRIKLATAAMTPAVDSVARKKYEEQRERLRHLHISPYVDVKIAPLPKPRINPRAPHKVKNRMEDRNTQMQAMPWVQVDTREYLHCFDEDQLYWGAYNGDLEVVRAALARSANPNYMPPKAVGNLSPICWAVSRHQYHLVELLSDAAADVNFTSGQWGLTPLHIAASTGNPQMAKLLIERCATPSSTNSSGHDALVRADLLGHFLLAAQLQAALPQQDAAIEDYPEDGSNP